MDSLGFKEKDVFLGGGHDGGLDTTKEATALSRPWAPGVWGDSSNVRENYKEVEPP